MSSDDCRTYDGARSLSDSHASSPGRRASRGSGLKHDMASSGVPTGTEFGSWAVRERSCCSILSPGLGTDTIAFAIENAPASVVVQLALPEVDGGTGRLSTSMTEVMGWVSRAGAGRRDTGGGDGVFLRKNCVRVRFELDGAFGASFF